MDAVSIAKTLHPLEVRILLAYEPGSEIDGESVRRDLHFREGQENQAFSWLLGKGLIAEIARSASTHFELTALGQEYAEKGSPEERIIAMVAQQGPAKLFELAEKLGFEQKTIGSAFGLLSKVGTMRLDDDKRAILVGEASFPQRVLIIKGLLAKAKEAGGAIAETSLSEAELEVIRSVAKKRGAGDSPFRVVERERVVYRLTEATAEQRHILKSLGVTGEELGALTPALLESGDWKKGSFRPYNIGVSPARTIPGRKNPYVEFLESVKDKLVSLGFEEFDGNMVETEFWNSDALFMPQFHSARDIHDVYSIEKPSLAKFIEEPHLSRVAAAHENGGDTGSRGWNYTFDRDFTRRLILRSQGTVLSARQLPEAKVPGKYFGIVRCFRYDKVDATHLSDFYQTEGIVLGEDVNLRTLLGFLEMFAVEVAGAKEVKYVPGYFPFTEPSVEVHIKHPVLGWFELGGSGIFRPEVTKSLGIDVPVLAWGLGIDRMALMALGLNDLRELFSPDLESVRLRRALQQPK
ncbi:MAG: phenylalanine--tRNA ligase subunit alpha [Spirochaetia bacterium]|jgi:phenylalanyl-tRNA synthetase alpha chain|nr:phenylalanine--tRNA ligase subunit alpha [Spirochaetales bacterium]MDX9783457.1 phenylalanine--tRNA ligase subunit alpha [Spirochaetia bacterium]